MSEETPQLANDQKMSWYQGLTRYQWWVLILASMGWMFDTMDQQFFNLARDPAMRDVLNVDPLEPGMERMDELGIEIVGRYSADKLTEMVHADIITAEQRDTALIGRGKEMRDFATRKDIAKVLGEPILAERHKELAQQKLKEQQFDEPLPDTLQANDFVPLIEKDVVSREVAEDLLSTYDGAMSREAFLVYLGRQQVEMLVTTAGSRATTIFILGWAIGGLFFGWIGDTIGRAKTMALTILTYAVFTGFNAAAQTPMMFDIFRFLTALGVGGEFAAGAALVAESMPDRSRVAALGTLQALSAFGNMAAALLAAFILPYYGWRWLFLIGALPGLLAVVIFLKLKEPEKWRVARRRWLEEKAAGITQKRSSYLGLLSEWRWARRAIIGLLLGVVGVGALWGVAFFTPELNRLIAASHSEEAKERFVSYAFFLQQVGAFFGISAYTYIALKWGRKPGFALFFVLAFLVVSYAFLRADTIVEAYVLAPLIGFVTLGPFGGFAIYFPELFPTRLRSTGVGFCYNVGRFLAAGVPSFKNWLMGLFMSGALVIPGLASAVGDANLAIRYGSFLMLFVYIIGLIVLLFAPETKDQPLPED